MIKPTKPSETLPDSFGGIKENFSNDKITNGYEPDIPDILGGANVNYLIDTLGKKEKYYDSITDFINNMPIAKTITVDTNNNLVYKDFLGGRNFGELVYSAIPLSDSGLKLLDGSVIQGNGIYSNFVDYIASIVNTYSSIFVTEATWQQTVATYGVCGKFVYDSVNNTVRLPKVTGIIEGTVDLSELGRVIESGLPQHNHTSSMTSAGGHNHNRGDMNITGYIHGPAGVEGSGALSTQADSGISSVAGTQAYFLREGYISLNAASNWTGNTSWNGEHTHAITINNANNSIYKTSVNKVQPQTVKMYVYIVVANGITKTDVELDIDEIVSDLNGKADVDGSNLIENISTSAKEYFTQLSLPSGRHIDLPIGASETTYVAPANGYFYVGFTATAVGGWANLYNDGTKMDGSNVTRSAGYGTGWWYRVTTFARKDDVVLLTYGSCTIDILRFYYAVGSESVGL